MGPNPAARYAGTRPAGSRIKGGCAQCFAGSSKGCSWQGVMLKGLGSGKWIPKSLNPEAGLPPPLETGIPPASGSPVKGRREPCLRGCRRERMWEGGDVVPRDTISSLLTSGFLQTRMPLVCHREESWDV